MKPLFITLTVLAIISQTVHTYFVFNSFSRLSGGLKLFQSVIFCSIISIAIFAFVIIGNPALALIGALVEVVINLYYYGTDYFENGIRYIKAENRRAAVLRYWRRNWIAFFFGLIIPMLIYIFAQQLILLK